MKILTRDDVLSKAVDECMKEIYSYVYPKIEWDEFVKENKIYSEKYKEWESNKDKHSEWKNKSITECIGPRPYEFYYLPKKILKDICDNYVRVYRMDSQQELLNTIQILKNYCKEPIVDKYIEGKEEDGIKYPGHKGYDHPDNLEKEIEKLITDVLYIDTSLISKDDFIKSICDKFFEFLDMAGNFYNWNRELNSFNISIYLGSSPNSSKEAVIKNWKEYRKQDIEINEEQIKKEYYGDEDYD